MKKIILLFLFAGIIYSANSQQMQFDWIAQAGGPGWDIVTDMTELPNGQIIIVGTYYDSIYFQSDTLVSMGSRDIFIANYNLDGTLKKVASFGGIGYDYVKKIEPSGESEMVIPIKFNKEIEINGKSLKGQKSINFLITWIDHNLNPIDFAQVSSNGDFDITIMETAMDGDFYFSGWFTDTLFVESEMILPFAGKDIFLGKISKKGKLKWLTKFDGDSHDIPCSYIPVKEGFNLMAGITSTGCFGDNKAPEKVDKNMTHLYITQIKDIGDIGSVSYPLSGYDIELVDMINDRTSIWILVNFKNTVFLEGVDILANGKNDVLLIKYNLDNDSLKYYQLGSNGSIHATGIMKSGNQIIITGLFNGQLTFAGTEINSAKYSTDIFISSVNDECQPESIFTLTGEDSKFPCSAYASNSGIYVTGEFKNQLKAGKTELTSKGKEDIFLARIENCKAKDPLKIIVNHFDDTNTSKGWKLDAGEKFSEYLWNGGLSVSKDLIVSNPGEYKVTVVDKEGCVYADSVILMPNKSASIIDDIKDPHPFRMYPTLTENSVYWSPSSDWVSLAANVKVFDVTGKVVIRQEIPRVYDLEYHIDLSNQPEGPYVVEISGQGFRQSSKIVLKK